MSPSNKLIQQVADGFSHSVSSLVMRMKNFAAIDPNSKVKGATHAAKADRLIFDEFKNDWGTLSVQAESLTGLALFDANPINGAKPLSSLTDKKDVYKRQVETAIPCSAVLVLICWHNICLLFCLFIYIIANSKIREPLNLEYLRRPISVPFLQSRFILQKKENLMWETVGLFMVANLH